MTRRPLPRSPLPAARALAIVVVMTVLGASACSDAHSPSQLAVANPGFDPTVIVILAPDALAPTLTELDTIFTIKSPGVSFVLVSDVVSALRRTTRRRRLPATNDNSRTALAATLAPNVWIDATNSIKAYLPSTMKLYGRRPFGLDQIALVVRTGNPTHVAGLSAFAAGSGSKTGWCTVTTACGVLARDAVAAAHVHAAPSTTARSSYALIGALEEGRLDAVLAMSSDAANANTATTTVPISPPPARFLTYDTVLLDQSSLAAQYAAWIATSPLAGQILAAHGFVRRPPKAP